MWNPRTRLHILFNKRKKININDFLSSNRPKPELDPKNQYLDPKLSNELKNVVIKEILTWYNMVTINTIIEIEFMTFDF